MVQPWAYITVQWLHHLCMMLCSCRKSRRITEDWEGPTGVEVDTVDVPETPFPVGFSLEVHEIESAVDPMASSDQYCNIVRLIQFD